MTKPCLKPLKIKMSKNIFTQQDLADQNQPLLPLPRPERVVHDQGSRRFPCQNLPSQQVAQGRVPVAQGAATGAAPHTTCLWAECWPHQPPKSNQFNQGIGIKSWDGNVGRSEAARPPARVPLPSGKIVSIQVRDSYQDLPSPVVFDGFRIPLN